MVIGQLQLTAHARRALDLHAVDPAARGRTVAEVAWRNPDPWLRPVRGDVVVHAGHMVDDESRSVADVSGQRRTHRRDRPRGDVAGGSVEGVLSGHPLDTFLDTIYAHVKTGGKLVQHRAPAER